MNNTLKRLPCRGCLPTCKNYDICEGVLWRLPMKKVAPKTETKQQDIVVEAAK